VVSDEVQRGFSVSVGNSGGSGMGHDQKREQAIGPNRYVVLVRRVVPPLSTTVAVAVTVAATNAFVDVAIAIAIAIALQKLQEAHPTKDNMQGELVRSVSGGPRRSLRVFLQQESHHVNM